MARIFRFLRIVFVLALVAIGVFALVISHDSACGEAPPLPGGSTPMQAWAYRCYGSADVLKLESLAKPVPGDEQVLVRVRATSLNPLDWHYLHGTPYIMRMESGIGVPGDPRLGVDFAGVVEAVGSKVKKFKPGDEVFGGAGGAFADYVLVRQDRAVALKPARLSFEQAAAINIAGITALQALRNEGKLQAGQKVLINGASGGVGTFAVQIAKALGADVTGVCSTRNRDMVRALGADRVVDYTQEDFTRGDVRYDLIIDLVGNRGIGEIRRVLAADGRLVIVGGPKGNWIGPMTGALKAFAMSPFVDQQMAMMLARTDQTDLETLGEMVDSGKLAPVIDRVYPMQELPEAMRYLEEGHARGKVVVTIGEAANSDSAPGDQSH